MWKPRRAVCLWSLYDFEEFQRTHIRPSCELHEHISRDEAIGLTRDFQHRERIGGGNLGDKMQFRYIFEAAWVDPVKPSQPWNKVTQPRPKDGIEPFEAIYFMEPREWLIKKSAGFDVHQLARY